MRLLGEFTGAQKSLDGDLIISFVTDESDKVLSSLEELKNKRLTIDLDKFNEKRSKEANRYFWELCTLIAQKLGNNKDAVYLMQLKNYGVWVDIEVIREAVKDLKSKFRYVEEFDDGFNEYKDSVICRCYFGSSHYDTKEMSVLIDGTVRDAEDLGIPTRPQEEIDALIRNWKGDTYG